LAFFFSEYDELKGKIKYEVTVEDIRKMLYRKLKDQGFNIYDEYEIKVKKNLANDDVLFTYEQEN
jgi:uncharacterized protein (DUF302 family)